MKTADSRGRLLILGAGGHGKVAADCATESGNWSEVIFFDDRWPALSACACWLVAGHGHDLPLHLRPDDQAFVAIGDSVIRKEWIYRLQAAGAALATVAHPRACISRLANIGAGSLIVGGAVINAGTRIGIGAIINTGATVDHDCTIGDFVHVAPGANVAGGVHIDTGAFIGIGAAIRQRITVGVAATIGAGAAVVRDVPDHGRVAGVPARSLRPNDDTDHPRHQAS